MCGFRLRHSLENGLLAWGVIEKIDLEPGPRPVLAQAFPPPAKLGSTQLLDSQTYLDFAQSFQIYRDVENNHVRGLQVFRQGGGSDFLGGAEPQSARFESSLIHVPGGHSVVSLKATRTPEGSSYADISFEFKKTNEVDKKQRPSKVRDYVSPEISKLTEILAHRLAIRQAPR